MTMMMGRTVAVLAVLALASVAPAQTATPKQMKVARKLIAKLKLVDGTGSGLDADTLDGIDSSAFVQKSELPTIGHFSCAGTTTVPYASAEAYDGNNSERFATGGFVLLRCNVVVPDGATVTAASCTLRDSDATKSSYCEMWRTSSVNGAEEQMADLGATSDAGTPGVTQLTTSTITNGTIDNGGFSYFLQAGINGTNSNMSLIGFNLTYSIAPAGSPAPLSAAVQAPPARGSGE